MSHSFLPVNPCCTDVVLNSPCGCSSTITNSSCSNNLCETNLTLSSTIVYNGPALSCIIAEPCDTLNVVLQKIDSIICNLLSQINILNIQVTNINNQIITINTNIVDINNTLDVCCGSATTTTTTTECPCTYFSFIGGKIDSAEFTFVECGASETTTISAGDLPLIYCLNNSYPVIQIGNGSYNNTHDCCTPFTTTTSTTLPLAYCYDIEIVNKCSVYWTDAQGNAQVQSATDTTIYICAQPDTIASACEAFGSIIINGGTVVCTNESICQPPTTTTTTTVKSCIEITVDAAGNCIDFPGFSVLEYTDCEGVYQTVQVSSGDLPTFCTLVGGVTPAFICGDGNIAYGSSCVTPTTTSTSTSSSSTTTTTTTCPCKSYNIVVSGEELIEADGNTIYVTFDDCFGDSQQYEYTTPGTYTAAFCADQSKVPLQYYIIDGVVIRNSLIQPASAGCCTGKCTEYTIQALVEDGSWTGIGCDTLPRGGIIIYPNIEVVCLKQGTLSLTNALVISETDCST